MAQVVEHVLGKDEVTGSSPVSSSKKGLSILIVLFLFYIFKNSEFFGTTNVIALSKSLNSLSVT